MVPITMVHNFVNFSALSILASIFLLLIIILNSFISLLSTREIFQRVDSSEIENILKSLVDVDDNLEIETAIMNSYFFFSLKLLNLLINWKIININQQPILT